jgi:hypothetical protein
MIRTLVPALLIATALAASGEDKNTDLALDPVKAVADFAIQGEYEAAAADKLGVQVIALGGGTFRVCVEAGGLPGAGWDGMGKVQIEGKAEGGKLAVAGKGWKVALEDGTATAVDETNQRTVTLKRVVRQSPTMGAKPRKAPSCCSMAATSTPGTGRWTSASC